MRVKRKSFDFTEKGALIDFLKFYNTLADSPLASRGFAPRGVKNFFWRNT